jgi:16S rRNA (cytosine967-C5)-methyltransferase
VWDCCAASGGKSVLLNDILSKKIDLTVSDIRATIILMLHRRFKKAGIKEYKYFIADITGAGFKPGDLDFDLVICDAPCTGSGTWSRTPEQLCFFKPSAITEYQQLQKKIVSSVLPHVKPNGLFIYITCSVFEKENEAIAELISQNFNCKLLQMQLLKGYDKKADNMFVAVFRKL